jgi:hypothetical protein
VDPWQNLFHNSPNISRRIWWVQLMSIFFRTKEDRICQPAPASKERKAGSPRSYRAAVAQARTTQRRRGLHKGGLPGKLPSVWWRRRCWGVLRPPSSSCPRGALAHMRHLGLQRCGGGLPCGSHCDRRAKKAGSMPAPPSPPAAGGSWYSCKELKPRRSTYIKNPSEPHSQALKLPYAS